jgi:putative ATPase
MQRIPLAERMRPTSIDDYIGQGHLMAENGPLRNALNAGILPSIILWGPPGVGKTTLAQLLAEHLKRPIYTLSAINSGVKDVREVISKIENSGMFNQKGAILFIDEIHRFSKSQQDSLLGAVEKGIVTLIGATTENPSFEVIGALLSRCQVYVLQSHTKNELEEILKRAIEKDYYLKEKNIKFEETDALLFFSGGDARKLLNLLEVVVSVENSKDEILLTNEKVKSIAQQHFLHHDKNGEQHYDLISAFIKSIRGSDPNAAVYYLARMIAGGEDPKFIARRLIILASEDIGLANSNALLMANTCFDTVEKIGWPESRIILSHCVIYLATSPKGNAAYKAINSAQELVNKTGNLPIPLQLRNAPTQLMKDLNYGTNYKYAHDFGGNFVNQEFMPDEIVGTNFFIPGSSPKEIELKKLIDNLWPNKY